MSADPWLIMVALLSDPVAARVLIESALAASLPGRVFRTEPDTDDDE
jgi:hypothetical protein